MKSLHQLFESALQKVQSGFQSNSPWNRQFDFSDFRGRKTRIILKELDEHSVSLSEQTIERGITSTSIISAFAPRSGPQSFNYDIPSPEKIIFPSIRKEDAVDAIDEHVHDINMISASYDKWHTAMKAPRNMAARYLTP